MPWRRPGASGPLEYALTLERLLDASVSNVWRRWTEPVLLEQWFCPTKPWCVTDARIGLRPGGEFSSVMHGPNGEEFEAAGAVLEVVPRKRLVTIDAFRPSWIPSGRAFMVTEILLETAGTGRTRYMAHAGHWDEAARAEHEATGSTRDGARQRASSRPSPGRYERRAGADGRWGGPSGPHLTLV